MPPRLRRTMPLSASLESASGVVAALGAREDLSRPMTAPMSHSAKAMDAMPGAPEAGQAEHGDDVRHPHGPRSQGARLLDDPRRDGGQHGAAVSPVSETTSPPVPSSRAMSGSGVNSSVARAVIALD